MYNFQKPSEPLQTTYATIEHLEPFVMPDQGNDKYFIYITAVKEDAPFEYDNVGPVDFAKRCLPADASYRDIEKPMNYILPTKFLTEKQAAAVLERAKEMVKVIPSRFNPDYDAKENPEEKEYLPEERHIFADWLIFCKAEDYKPTDELLKYLEAERIPEAADESEKFREEVYKAQSGKDKKKGK